MPARSGNGLRRSRLRRPQGPAPAALFLGEDGERPTSALYLNCGPENPAGGLRGLRTHCYTYVVQRDADGRETTLLYGNDEDQYQRRDVAAQRPQTVAQLRDEMNCWLRRTRDPWLGPCPLPA